MNIIPSECVQMIYEFAGGRPKQPTSVVMRAHIEHTLARLENQPCLWSSTAWDLVRALQRHNITWYTMDPSGKWVKRPVRKYFNWYGYITYRDRGGVKRGKSQKSTLPDCEHSDSD